jgi:adenosylcobinamide-phosphate synthase
MNRGTLVSAAWLVDQIAGDPEWLPHPVRLIGLATARGEASIRRPHQSELSTLVSGASLTFAVVVATYYVTRQTIHLASRQSPALGNTVELLLAWTCLAAQNLQQEATSVTNALDSGDIPLARRRLARIVGRDTAHLDTHEICRATIETLAESASDGILAPIFYMALGGVPLAMAYKAVNTLDSMIGHADERYLYFGKPAARLDDAANYLPARLTAASIFAASAILQQADAAAAYKTWRRDSGHHKSPNAGHPESAMAGALHVQLGGDNTYQGEVVSSPRIGNEFPPPDLSKVKRAIRVVSLVTLFGVACVVVSNSFRTYRARKVVR